MALGGEIFTAEEARQFGVVDMVVGTGTAVEAARDYAKRVAARGPAALEIAKLMIASANGEDNGTAVEALGSILVAKTADLREGVAAFSEKRPAHSRENGNDSSGEPEGAERSQGTRLQDADRRQVAVRLTAHRSSASRQATASSSAASRPARRPMPSAPSPPPARRSTPALGRRMTASERSAILLKAADLIAARADELAYLDAIEAGKPITQVKGEIGGSVDIWRYAAALARDLHGESYNTLGDGTLGVVLREAIGVVSIITPWNFPFLIVGQKLPLRLPPAAPASSSRRS
jgi:hypothetical protein